MEHNGPMGCLQKFADRQMCYFADPVAFVELWLVTVGSECLFHL